MSLLAAWKGRGLPHNSSAHQPKDVKAWGLFVLKFIYLYSCMLGSTAKPCCWWIRSITVKQVAFWFWNCRCLPLAGIEQDAVNTFTKHILPDAAKPIPITEAMRNDIIGKKSLKLWPKKKKPVFGYWENFSWIWNSASPFHVLFSVYIIVSDCCSLKRFPSYLILLVFYLKIVAYVCLSTYCVPDNILSTSPGQTHIIF